MSLTYDVLLDHIANFLIYISDAPSFWFSLNTSYDHGCHLASKVAVTMARPVAAAVVVALLDHIANFLI